MQSIYKCKPIQTITNQYKTVVKSTTNTKQCQNKQPMQRNYKYTSIQTITKNTKQLKTTINMQPIQKNYKTHQQYRTIINLTTRQNIQTNTSKNKTIQSNTKQYKTIKNTTNTKRFKNKQ